MAGQKSQAEQAFSEAWAEDGLPVSDYTTQYQWCPGRRFKADVAFPSQKLLIEINGRGRHQTVAGTRMDYEKYNLAIEHGWRTLLYQAADKRYALEWVEQVMRVLCSVSATGGSP